MSASLALFCFPLITLASVSLVQIPYLDKDGRMEVQAHRGGSGLRSEETAWAYAYAMEIGADVLEMDTVFTSDGVPVVWHDHNLEAGKCRGPYTESYIANLTLAQVKEMDCSVQLSNDPQQQIYPGSTIQTLEEVLDLIECYGDPGVRINLETKLDPTKPNETLAMEKYITDIVPLLQSRNFASRTTIQSFDWRTIVAIKRIWPEIVTIALLDDITLAKYTTTELPYPWLGGLNLDDFGGDWVAAAHATGASAVGPVHGFPSNATINTVGYEEFVTKANTAQAHDLGMKVITWTVDDEATISKLIDDGVDSIMSDFPERVLDVARKRGLSVGRARRPSVASCLITAGR